MAAAFFGWDNPFDNNLSIRGNKKFLSPSFRGCEPQRFAQCAPDDGIFIDVNRHARQGAHASSGVVSDPGHSRQAFARCFYALSVTFPVVGPFAEADGDLSRANQAQSLIGAVVNILAVIIHCGYDRAEDSPSA